MTIGTRSVLFGVHQFLWHPFTVFLAWKAIHGRNPTWWEAVAIVCHDLGYIGCTDMDGEESDRNHPIRGAEITRSVVVSLNALFAVLCDPIACGFNGDHGQRVSIRGMLLGQAAYNLALGHSRYFAAANGMPVSDLFQPDKVSLMFDPKWWYLLRATLSGEVFEYISHSPLGDVSISCWFDWYKRKVVEKFV